jgi:hypothetical protein
MREFAMATTTSTVNINGVIITLTPGSTVVVNGITATLDEHGHVAVTTSAAPGQSVANGAGDGNDVEHESGAGEGSEDTGADEEPRVMEFDHAWLLNILSASTKDYPYLDAFNLDRRGIVLHSVEYQTQDGYAKHYESFAIDSVKDKGKDYLITGKIEDGSWRSLYASRLFPEFIELGSLPQEVLDATK